MDNSIFIERGWQRKFGCSSKDENKLSLDAICKVCGDRYGQHHVFKTQILRCHKDLNKYHKEDPNPEDMGGCFSYLEYSCRPITNTKGLMELIVVENLEKK